MNKHIWYFLLGFDTIFVIVGIVLAFVAMIQGIIWLAQNFIIGLGVIGVLVIMYITGWFIDRVGLVKRV